MDKEQELASEEDVREARSKVTAALVHYLETYKSDKTSDSKHALMGPVGKLLPRITTTGDINWESVKGYVLSIHKNLQAPRGVSPDAAIRLDEAVAALKHLRSLLPPTKWLKTVEDIDDEVFFGLYKGHLIGQRKGIQKKFHDWLRQESSLDEVNALLPEEDQYASIEDIEDPFSTPTELEEIVGRFWKNYKKKKEGKK
ncbi:MAG: hypothetical protein ACP6KW_06740 [Candidatus Thorarchaeota archaeon]|nr:MAG: hypothetical protein DRP09_16725 [Candidatus Thorarchaeota archaeon]